MHNRPVKHILIAPLVAKHSGEPEQVLQLFQKKTEKFWNKRGALMSQGLYHEMSTSVPAYKKFLKRKKGSVSTKSRKGDWDSIPITNKQNYLQSFSTAELAWGGSFAGRNWTIASTSGSTGIPYYFPRTHLQDLQFALTADIAFKEIFGTDNKSTLFINCFALGVWIGGMFMSQTLKLLSDTGRHKLAVINPGADHVEALRAVSSLGAQFDQVIIGGYAPLVKDLLDRGAREGINWKSMHVKYFFAAEGFTEEFRDYLKEHGGSRDIYRDAINHYGTADMGTMAHETPASIFIRRYARGNSKLNMALFGTPTRQPTLCQYVPELFNFEAVDGRLLCSSYSGLPLVRYDLKDSGGILSWKTITDAFEREANADLSLLLKMAGLSKQVWNLPFVYVHERNDLTISIYSVNIYPENVKRAIESRKFEKSLTGKFSMLVDYDARQNQYWEVVVELHPDIRHTATLKRDLLTALVKSLSDENSEWKDFYDRADIHDKVLPRISFRNYQDPELFSGKGKQRWVKK